MTDTERIQLIDQLKTYEQFDDFHGSGKYYFKLQILTDDFKEKWVRRIMRNLRASGDSKQTAQEQALLDISGAHFERKKVGQTEADVKYIVDFLILIHTGAEIEENIKGDVINSVAPLRQPKTCEKGVIIPSDGNFPKNSNRNYGMLNEFNTMMYHWMEDINIHDRSGNDPDAFIDYNGVEGFNPYGTSIEDATFNSLSIYGGLKFIHCRKNCLIEDPNGSILRNHPEKGPIYFGLNIPVKPPYYYELSMLYALIMENHFTLQNTTETFLAELEAILDIEHHDAFKSLQRLLRPYIEDTKRRLKQKSAKNNINEEPILREEKAPICVELSEKDSNILKDISQKLDDINRHEEINPSPNYMQLEYLEFHCGTRDNQENAKKALYDYFYKLAYKWPVSGNGYKGYWQILYLACEETKIIPSKEPRDFSGFTKNIAMYCNQNIEHGTFKDTISRGFPQKESIDGEMKILFEDIVYKIKLIKGKYQ